MHNYNKIAIVTGAARGIGAATAERLARDGNAVAVVDLDEAACQETVARIVGAGGRAVGLGADVGRTEAVAAAIARIADELGPPSILVNNAGITRDNLSFKMTDSDWDDVITVHLAEGRLTAGEQTIDVTPLPAMVLDILDAGGLLPRLVADGYLAGAERTGARA